MTILFRDGFESNDFTAWPYANPSALIVANPVHHGQYAASFNGDFINCNKGISAGEVYGRGYFRWTTLPANENRNWLMSFRIAGESHGCQAIITVSGGIVYWELRIYESDNAYHSYLSTTPTPTVDTWYCVEMRYKRNTVGGGQLWVNGNLILTTPNTAYDEDMTLFIAGPEYLNSGTVYADCAVVADSRIGCERRFLPLTRNMNPRFQSRTLQHM